MSKKKFSKNDAMAFLLTHIVVDQAQSLQLTPALLLSIMNLSEQAATTIQQNQHIIPHELVESMPGEFLLELNLS
ncbi:MAG: hypothetical protein HOL98_09940 [Gammaproteobacteria bacterium]|jgi:hypothetical protein|nr:hypothetical protein [Gammaproteobacteria bacterium]MBT5203763.1 hypothetical protein [Gammaproteobacteria bacterium]MBT5601808.1 hypothetical protein [Gammaproteobacteria bacterium]MBT6247432.1 hypothetical protein [Gammaproteobacteria bacterium]